MRLDVFGTALLLFVCFHPLDVQSNSVFPSQVPAGEDDYVGSGACGKCHETEYARWRGSYHDLAMQQATEETVLGNYDSASYDHFGTISTFLRRDGVFFVRTDGPDGSLQEYPIAYTFGAYPLQQYLIAFPGGRLQTLDIAWDARPKEKGGQRWFHLHPRDPVRHDDVLHWTGPNLNWNYMCADCHSTNLRKNYNAKTDAYETTWSEIDVGCEACHGPGARHLHWAQANKGRKVEPSSDMELPVLLRERAGVGWVLDAETGKPHRSIPNRTRIEIQICAACHSRRSQMSKDHQPGKSLFDAYLPALLTQGLYYSDGQMQDEVYVYGSFLQSRMAQAGVICSDCHEPHSGNLRLPGSEVCSQCHDPKRYEARAHHFHEPGSTGASCIECHMPATTYMQVDQRNDHSLRIPRPDLSIALGTPNACTSCHSATTDAWAMEAMTKWYGKPSTGLQRFAPALAAARGNRVEAKGLLKTVIEDETQPAIARATALQALSDYLDRDALPLIARSLQNDDPMLRWAALDALSPLDAKLAWPLASALLEDDRRSVRVQAARLLASAPPAELSDADAKKLRKALDEYIAAQHFNAERPESQVNLGGIYADLGEFEKAEAAYRRALVLQGKFIPAYVNLSHLLQRMDREAEGEALLRDGLTRLPESADLHHALGLSLARQKRLPEALQSLGRAVALAPESPRYGYVYGVALASSSKLEEGLRVLDAAHQRAPGNEELLQALIAYNRNAGRLVAARKYAQRLLELVGNDPALTRLRELDAAISTGGGQP